MNKKVCLIIPPSPFLLDERAFPFIGILKLPPILQNAGIDCEVLDLSGIRNFLDVISQYISSHNTTHFGITATTPQFPAAYQIASLIRKASPSARIIIGGTHATLTYAGVKYEKSKKVKSRAHRAFDQLVKSFDVIVAGDGETTIVEALSDNAPQLIDADERNAEYFLRSGAPELENILPARNLIDLSTYKYSIDGKQATSLIAQLGCPYKCAFCAGRNSPSLRFIRTRSSESIVREMLHINEVFNITGLMFYDDELNVNPKIVNLMQLIAKTRRDKGIDWKLRGFIKSERFTIEQAEAMYEAGFREILVGFEAGSPQILTNIQKVATQQDNTRCMDIARKSRLRVKALMSMGHAGESEGTIKETQRWLIDVKPDDFDITVITPYPGSPYYDEAVEDTNGNFVYTTASGDRLFQKEVIYHQEAHYYKGDPAGGYTSYVWTDHLSAQELVDLRNATENDVRSALGIPFNPSRAAQSYEHSMGQSSLPKWILRS